MLQNTNIKWETVEEWMSIQIEEKGLMHIYNKVDRLCWGPLDIEILDELFNRHMERLNVANSNSNL